MTVCPVSVSVQTMSVNVPPTSTPISFMVPSSMCATARTEAAGGGHASVRLRFISLTEHIGRDIPRVFPSLEFFYLFASLRLVLHLPDQGSELMPYNIVWLAY